MKKTKKDFLETILKKKTYIILISVIFAITAVCYTLTNVEFVASKKILLGESDKISTYKELLTGSELLGNVIENLGISINVQDLEKVVEATSVDDTNMIEIKVTGRNSLENVSILNEIITVFSNKVQEIYGDVPIFNVDDSAKYYSKGNSIIAGIVAFVIGGVASILFFTICLLLDNNVKSCSQIEEITELKSLISIPYMKNIAKKRLNIRNIRPHRSEIFKLLMTNIQFVNSNNLQSKAIVITSPKSFEGKTYVATNLAIEFAKAGKKVILIDADMNKGRLTKIFNLPNDLGLSNYLSNLDSNGNHINERINSFINDTEIKNLNVITSGNRPPNPTELLKSQKLKELIKDLKVFYDIIVFDTVCILDAQEAKILSGMSDLTLMMSAYGNTKINDFTKAYDELENINGIMIGVGLNKIPDRKVRRKFSSYKNRFKVFGGKIWKKIDFEKLRDLLERLKGLKEVFESIASFCMKIVSKLKKLVQILIYNIKLKSRNIREHIKSYKSEKEDVRLIEASEENQEKNIVREVFENELAKKLEISEPVEQIEEAPIISYASVIPEKQFKSKFDLMKEQQEKGTIISDKVEVKVIEENKVEKKEKTEKPKKGVVKFKSKTAQTQQEMKKVREELVEKQRIEREKKEAEKKKLVSSNAEDFQDVNFINEENITEEMIKHQVEIDDMIRSVDSELEQENSKKQKILEKRKEREARKELKAKMREEKKAIRERNRQLRREENRLREDLQEDNLYPKIRM